MAAGGAYFPPALWYSCNVGAGDFPEELACMAGASSSVLGAGWAFFVVWFVTIFLFFFFLPSSETLVTALVCPASSQAMGALESAHTPRSGSVVPELGMACHAGAPCAVLLRVPSWPF